MADKSIHERLDALEARAAASHTLLQKLVANVATLWAVSDIALHCGYTVKTVRGVILKDKNFPRPRMMPGGGKRWMAAEVRQYFKDLERG